MDQNQQETGRREAPLPHRREFSRVPVQLRAEVTLDGGQRLHGMMDNISLKGGFLRTAGAPAGGTPCDIRMYLEGTGVEVHAQGTVVRPGEGGVAIQFTDIVGIESLDHLRNLIRFNAHDPHQVEQEFHEHVGLKRGC